MNIFSNKIFKNFSVLTGSSAALQLLWMLSSIRIARQLEPEGYGLINLVNVQVTIFSIIATFGLRNVIIRQVARNRMDAGRLFKISNRIRIVTTILASITAIGYNLLASDKSLSGSFVLVLVLTIIVSSFNESIETIAFGVEKMQASGYINLLFSGFFVALIYLIPEKYFTISTVLYITLLNQYLRTFVYLKWLQKKVLPGTEKIVPVSKEEYTGIIRQSNYFFILAVFSVLQNQVPVVLLQYNSTIDQIGIFSLGNRMLAPLQLVLNTMMTALFPMFSRLAISDMKLFASRVKSLLNILVIVGLVGCVGFSFFSREIVLILYGKEYLDSANIILIQCWFIVLFGIFCIIGTVLSSLDKQKLLALLSIIYGLSAIPIFFVGTKHGAYGLSIAFVVAAVINMTYHWIVFGKVLQNRISLVYSALIFVPLILSFFLTTSFSFNLGLLPKIFAVIILCSVSVYYIYKVEFKRIADAGSDNY